MTVRLAVAGAGADRSVAHRGNRCEPVRHPGRHRRPVPCRRRGRCEVLRPLSGDSEHTLIPRWHPWKRAPFYAICRGVSVAFLGLRADTDACVLDSAGDALIKCTRPAGCADHQHIFSPGSSHLSLFYCAHPPRPVRLISEGFGRRGHRARGPREDEARCLQHYRSSKCLGRSRQPTHSTADSYSWAVPATRSACA